ncbi:MAG: SDR family oxidoreductase [Balneolaceae bacterium]|nr:SDR family oxidoreductase [Balneolaceae bacterium]
MFSSSSVLITGASRGIGREVAIGFASETDRPLILVARTEKDLQQTKLMCQDAGADKVCVIPCDLSTPKAVTDIQLPANISAPGILINNAGSYLLKTLHKTSYMEYINQIKSNLFSAVHIVNRFLPELKKLDRGLIINICSSGALEGLPDSGAYASSKHALLGYSRSLRQELMDTEIGVTALNLGQTQSTSWEGSEVDSQKLIDPKDVAQLLVSLTKLSPRSVVEEIIMKPQHGRVPPM